MLAQRHARPGSCRIGKRLPQCIGSRVRRDGGRFCHAANETSRAPLQRAVPGRRVRSPECCDLGVGTPGHMRPGVRDLPDGRPDWCATPCYHPGPAESSDRPSSRAHRVLFEPAPADHPRRVLPDHRASSEDGPVERRRRLRALPDANVDVTVERPAPTTTTVAPVDAQVPARDAVVVQVLNGTAGPASRRLPPPGSRALAIRKVSSGNTSAQSGPTIVYFRKGRAPRPTASPRT